MRTTDSLQLERVALACWASEIPHTASAEWRGRGNRKQALYFKARAVVVYDRAMRGLLGQPVRRG